MRVYKREKYLKRIRGFFHDTGIIKVITGVRRCGKSCLMQSIADELSENGISKEQIIYINLDKKGYRSIKTPDELEAKIDELCISDGTKYLFIDEVQNVDGFTYRFIRIGSAMVINIALDVPQFFYAFIAPVTLFVLFGISGSFKVS